MRQVAVTEGDKVEAQLRLGFSVNGYGIGDLAEATGGGARREVVEGSSGSTRSNTSSSRLLRRRRAADIATWRPRASRAACGRSSTTAGSRRSPTRSRISARLAPAARVSASQRLMADGYGFGAEGDWKTAALLRIAKVMAAASGRNLLHGGLHLRAGPRRRRGARGPHARGVPVAGRRQAFAARFIRCRSAVAPIPVRLVFDAAPGPAVSSRWSTSAIVSVCRRTRSMSLRPPSRCPSCPSHVPCGRRGPTSRRPARPGSMAGGAHHTVFQPGPGSRLSPTSPDRRDRAARDRRARRNARVAKELRWNQAYYRPQGVAAGARRAPVPRVLGRERCDRSMPVW